MILKKSLIVAALMSMPYIAANAATTVDGGVVHFKGDLVNAACAVDSDSADQTIPLGQYRTASFTGVGTVAPEKQFDIKLTDCDTTVSNTASVSFSGPVDAENNSALSLTSGSGSAKGVGIQIKDGMNGNPLQLDGSVFSAPVQLIDGTNVLHFSAQYIQTAEDVFPGEANADATFQVQYE